jgi:hypothetical protein
VRRYGEAVGVPPQPRVVGRRWVGSEGYLAQEEDKETAGESDSEAAVGGSGRIQRPRGIRATGHALGRPFPKLNLCDAVISVLFHHLILGRMVIISFGTASNCVLVQYVGYFVLLP